MTKHYRPIEYRQVCAIARVAFLNAPQMSDAEWKAAIKDTCEKQGWDNPPPDVLSRAMSAVERALEQTVGPRRMREHTPPPQPPKPDKGWTKADRDALAQTIKSAQARSAGAAPTNVLTIPQERWEISEPAALDEFYRQAQTDRLTALKRFAEIAIARPADWDYQAVRAERPSRMAHHDGRCYACRKPSRVTVSHHIIQIQHGGSNYVRNRVDICEPCHAAIHPWLPAVARPKPSGWFGLADIAPTALAVAFAEWQQKAAAGGEK